MVIANLYAESCGVADIVPVMIYQSLTKGESEAEMHTLWSALLEEVWENAK